MLFLLLLGVAAVGPMPLSKAAVAAVASPAQPQLREPGPVAPPDPAPVVRTEVPQNQAPQSQAPQDKMPQDNAPQDKAPPQARARQVPVLIYHHLLPTRVANELAYNEMIVTTESFEEQMQRLVDEGYHTITTQQVAQFVRNGAPLPDKPVLITFDDGYESTYQYAYPILHRLNLKATVFVVTGWIRSASAGFNPRRLSYMTWGQLQEMSASGVFDVQSHTTDMHRFIKDQPAAKALPDAVVLADLVNARQTLKGHLGLEVKAFAYPYGSYNQHLIDLVKQAGYDIAFGVDSSRALQQGDAPYSLHRFGVFRRHWIGTVVKMLDGSYS